jgi:serine/threonine protein phosphatase PrpC
VCQVCAFPFILDSCFRYAAEEIPSHILSSLRSSSALSLPEVLYQSYIQIDQLFIRSNSSGLKAGSTATILLYDHSTGQVCVGNAGDTRAVLSRLHTAVDLSRDMKASDPLEVARVLRNGGTVSNGRVLGSLAVARALGDCQLKYINKAAVIPNPEITSFQFQSDDAFIVIASDGLWDVMSSQTVVDTVWTALTEQNLYPVPCTGNQAIDERARAAVVSELGKIGEMLASHACNTLNSSDNITVTIILLQHNLNKRNDRERGEGGEKMISPRARYTPTSQSFISSSNSTSPIESSSRSNSVPPVNLPSGNGGLAEKRKIESKVDDDDLMRFLLDDSNF